MSSTNKTSLGLNMWEASDKPVRQDFINDNVIIDEKITKLKQDYSNGNVILDEKITKLNNNLCNEPSLGIGFLSSSNIYVSKSYGIVSLRIAISANDVPSIAAYSNANLPVTVPTPYQPVVEQGNIRFVVDSPQLEGTFLYVREDGAIGVGTRYNGTTPGIGHMYAGCSYRSK